MSLAQPLKYAAELFDAEHNVKISLYKIPANLESATALITSIKTRAHHPEAELEEILTRISSAAFLTDTVRTELGLPVVSESPTEPHTIQLNATNYGLIYTAVQNSFIEETPAPLVDTSADAIELENLRATNIALRNELDTLGKSSKEGKAKLVAVLATNLRKPFALAAKSLAELSEDLSTKSEEVLDDRISLLFEELSVNAGNTSLTELRIYNPLEGNTRTSNSDDPKNTSTSHIEFEDPVELEPVRINFNYARSLLDHAFSGE